MMASLREADDGRAGPDAEGPVAVGLVPGPTSGNDFLKEA